MCGLCGLLPTSGEGFMEIAPLEIYLLKKIVIDSTLILPTEESSGEFFLKLDLTQMINQMFSNS